MADRTFPMVVIFIAAFASAAVWLGELLTRLPM
jgi:hypothetical protein